MFLQVAWNEIRYLLGIGWDDLLKTDFSQIRYSQTRTALYAAGIVAGIILLKLILPRLLRKLAPRLFGRKRYSQMVSGHFISGNSAREFISKFIFLLPTLAIAIPLAAMIFVIADPFLASFRDEKKVIEARVRKDVRDVSGSMGFRFKNMDKSKAEIAMEAHLNFLEMRAGKGDRVSFSVFSNNPFLIQPFTVDEDIYYQQVYDAPWELGSTPADSYAPEYWESYLVPKSRYETFYGEGGTVMATLLRAVIKEFQEDDENQRKSGSYKPPAGRALLILTDAAISDFADTIAGIRQLKRLGVIVYIILIDESGDEESQAQSQATNPLLFEIQRNGGRYFPVSSPDSLAKAYREIDRLEKSKIELQKVVFKTSVAYKFIFISILALILIIPVGAVFQSMKHP